MTTYTVKQGDTLGKIAKRFYSDASRFTLIAATNAIANPDRLRVGQVLQIPDVGATAAHHNPAPSATQPVPQSGASRLDQLNERRLSTLHPIVSARGLQLLQRAGAEGLTLLVTQGVRTFAEQDALYAKGRTTKPIGKQHIVTRAKAGSSWHNFGLAFDIVVLDSMGKEDWNDQHPGWARAGEIGRSIGLEWGGDWRGFKDKPHFQYTGDLTLDVCRRSYATGLEAIWSRLA